MTTRDSSQTSSLEERLRSPDSRPQAGDQWGDWGLVEFDDGTFGLNYLEYGSGDRPEIGMQVRLDEAKTPGEREYWLRKAGLRVNDSGGLIRAFAEIFPSSFGLEGQLIP